MTLSTETTKWFSFAFGVGALSWGCDATQTYSPPTSPSVQVAPPVFTSSVQTAGPQYTLSGVVFEQTATGQAPLENVQLYCESCGEIGIGHTFAQQIGMDATTFRESLTVLMTFKFERQKDTMLRMG